MRLDPKIAFFLKNEAQINQWIELKDRARQQADTFYRSLAPEVGLLAKNLRENVQPYISLDEASPKLFLIRPGWLDADGALRIGIGLEWKIRSTGFGEIWGGVWLNEDNQWADRIRGKLIDGLRPILKQNADFATERWWPAWRYERPNQSEYWNDLRPYRQQLLDAIVEHWKHFIDLVETAAR